MKIVYLSAYYYPEKYAGEQICSSILECLAKTHKVHVITPQPTRGVTTEEHRNFKKEEVVNGVIVHRFKMKRESTGVLKRFLRYKKCERYYKKLAKQIGKADYVFATSTPPTIGVLAGKIAKKMGAKFIHNVQDLFPESLISSGILKDRKGLLWRMGKNIEKKTYKTAHHICVVCENFYNNLLSKGVPKSKLTLIPNWVDIDNIKPIDKRDNKLFDEFGIDKQKFNVVYAGNFGLAQGAEIILDVAQKLKDKSNVQFVIFGGGAGYMHIENEVQEKHLNNVVINTLLPKERLSEVYSLGDISLIICKKGVGKSALPSKTWSIMACNTPIIASFDLDSELAGIISKANAGVCVQPEDVDALCCAIMNATKNPLSVCSRKYLEENLAKDSLICKYTELFK